MKITDIFAIKEIPDKLKVKVVFKHFFTMEICNAYYIIIAAIVDYKLRLNF